MHPLLSKVEHRPFPVPTSLWVMSQTWAKLLFAHWPIKAEIIRDLVPDSLELDLFDGYAWVGIVPFVMNDVYPRYTPKTKSRLSNFLELNVRTYVVRDGIPGVYFFSLDCSNTIAVLIARKFYHLPYFRAKMSMHEKKDGIVDYTSERASEEAAIILSYRPTGDVINAGNGSIDRFLTERYCLYTTDSTRQLHRGVIHHDVWPLQPAEAEFEINSMTRPLGFELPDCKPLLHYSERIDTIEWPLSVVPVG
ncbi:MAG: DUF2071 domain-containing protein [Cyanobacteria bacterium SZAS LIN-5]|nr:DUF2071 domain-containing protein [Cyanobacteria bacterium SZAS LIN-5]